MNTSTGNNTYEEGPSIINTSFLYEFAPCGHISFASNENIVSINHTMLSWLQLTREEVYNKNFREILSKAGQFYYQMIVLPLLNMQGAVNEINFDILSADGTNFPCLFNAVAVVDEDKKLKFVHATIIKITDRKKYESELLSEKRQASEEKKRFEFLANIIPNLIFTASQAGKVNFVNARFYEYFNYSKSIFPNQSFWHLIYKNDRYQTARLWIECFKEQKTFGAEVRLKNAAGNYEWFLIRAVPYFDETGKVSTWYGSCTNVHEQKEKQINIVNELNRSLTTADKIISRKEETLKEIAFDQGHLIRMPLSNILGLIQIMETMEMDEDMQNVHALLSESSTHLDEVIKKIVDKTYTLKSV